MSKPENGIIEGYYVGHGLDSLFSQFDEKIEVIIQETDERLEDLAQTYRMYRELFKIQWLERTRRWY